MKMNFSTVFDLLSLFFFLNRVHFTASQIRRRQNHQIDWNSSNQFFHSSPAVINVRLGDTIDFLCPHYNQSSSTMEYNSIYLVSEIDYNLCFTENYQPLIRCDQPLASKRLIYTLSISKYLPYPQMPEFVDGQSYYLISTSNGNLDGVNQKYDGLCRRKNLRLIVDVQKFYRRYSISEANANQRRRRVNLTAEQRNSSANRRLTISFFVVLCHCLGIFHHNR